MPGFRVFLVALLLALGGYTALVVARHGLDLLPYLLVLTVQARGDMAIVMLGKPCG